MQDNAYKIIFSISILSILSVLTYCVLDKPPGESSSNTFSSNSPIQEFALTFPEKTTAWHPPTFGYDLFCQPPIPKKNPKLQEITPIEPKLYRIQLTGWTEQGSDALLMLSCKSAPQALIGKAGTTFPEQGFSIITFKKISQNKHGTKYPAPLVTILDHFLNREISLTNEPCFQ